MGDVTIERSYAYCGHCRQPVKALDAWAGLSRDSLTPRGRQMAVLAGSQMSFDQASVQLLQLCGIRVSDQTIRRACDRVGRQAKAYLEQEAAAVAPVREVQGRRELSIDGAKVNTTEGWREIRSVVVSRRQPASPASVGQWNNRDLPKPAARLAWAAIADSREVGEQVEQMIDRLGWSGGREVSVVADGAAWIWKQADQHLPHHEGCVDIWHVMEHLHAAGRTLHGEGEQARRWAERQRAKLFRYGARAYLTAHLRPQLQSQRRHNPHGEPARALRALFKYLARHHGRMNYRDRLRRGLPIGSGQVEGVCKNTLNRRLRKNNPRWRPQRAEHMAALCCLNTSNQWHTFWKQAA